MTVQLTQEAFDMLIRELKAAHQLLRKQSCPRPFPEDDGTVGACVDSDNCDCEIWPVLGVKK